MGKAADMQRPASIVTFERCYLGAWLLGLVDLALTWDERMAMAGDAAAGHLPPAAMTDLVLGVVAVTAAITLALWWFVARRASVVAKWIVLVFFALGLLGVISGIARGTMTPGVGGVLTVAQWVLQAVAVAMLFRPDTVPWFAGRTAQGGRR